MDIHRQHHKYLGFVWGTDSEVQYYMFRVLPFGLATACYSFTKLIRKATDQVLACSRAKSNCLLG